MNVNVLPGTRMNADEFLAWSARQQDDRYELVDGKIISMSRDSVQHNQTKANAWRALDDAVRAAGLPCLVFVDGVGVRINDKTLRIPDVMVHCGTRPDPKALIVEAPLIVVEVVSPSSEGDDIETKLVDYFSVASIRHYLIVYSEQRVMIHHRRNDSDNIDTRIMRDGEIALAPPGISVPVAALLGPSSAGAEVDRT